MQPKTMRFNCRPTLHVKKRRAISVSRKDKPLQNKFVMLSIAIFVVALGVFLTKIPDNDVPDRCAGKIVCMFDR